MSDLARRLVLAHGWNTTCYQIVNPGIERWFSAREDAVVGYVKRFGIRVVAGAPVCSLDRLAEVVAEFEAAEPHGSTCYFGAEERLFNLLSPDARYSNISLGAQPVWSPESWIAAFRKDKSLRAQLHRSRNKGVVVSEWTAERATRHPELARCLREWLHTRGLPPMHFLVEPETLDELRDRRIFVAEMDGLPIGFVTLSPVPRQSGWLTEQFVRGNRAPNGTVELMLDHAIRKVGAEGARMVTMGIVPLSKNADAGQVPGWLRLLIPWVRSHGRRFYNFEGLDSFKRKFHPDRWDPIHIISREPRFSPRTLYAIAAAFTERGPILTVGQALGSAIAQEARWLLKPRR